MSSTPPSETFQIPLEAAERYEAAFVPAFFAQWAPLVCDAGGVGPGQSVLDVACGTGIVARTAADRVGAGGKVIGLDLNDAMLAVAARVRPDIEWRQGDAAALPFPSASFDTALCQMALMFFPDRAAVLREMDRVVRPGGAVVVAVPCALGAQTTFAPFVELAARLVGPEAMSLLSAYFVCGDPDELRALVESAGLHVTSSRRHAGTYRAPSVDAMVTTEVESTPLIELITDEAYRQLREGAHDILRPFTTSAGNVEAPFECLIVAAVQERNGSHRR